ncbi:PAS domain-containing protein [Mycobacterium sp. KBS0706]|uniref:sensor histidine kinase n=1 Tax=Mycobacterium sp. KBS0706 TaxID=2578109 RepID=UPI00110F7220|nr:PAS domain-containing sensor histidine kinase [Mycobacterium sp. KBS0706]TSD90770.1 PAS domain-containing protein [Mycobacterium sp. KBS0706]
MNLVDLYRLMRNAHIQAQSIVDTIPEPLLVLDNSLRVEAVSRSFYDTFQVSEEETVGRPVYELGNGQWDIPDLRRLLEEVAARSTAVVEFEVDHDFPSIGRRTMLVSAHRLFQPDRSSRSMLVSIVDASKSRQREAESELLVGELRHRIKNLLAMIQALAQQTMTEGRSAEQYRDDFLGRFRSLAAAQDLAFGGEGETGLRSLVEQTIQPFAGKGKVVIEPGPAVGLARSQIVPISLILHELATNALKYGALSAPEGRVQIGWRIERDSAPRLRVHWQEHDGPPVTPPATTGFGTRLIEFAASRELGGRVELDYQPSGLTVEILLPIP